MTKLFMYTANNTVKIIVKLCKYPVVYLDGKTRVENNKSKLKKKTVINNLIINIF